MECPDLAHNYLGLCFPAYVQASYVATAAHILQGASLGGVKESRVLGGVNPTPSLARYVPRDTLGALIAPHCYMTLAAHLATFWVYIATHNRGPLTCARQ